jgi:hypothetical protein
MSCQWSRIAQSSPNRLKGTSYRSECSKWASQLPRKRVAARTSWKRFVRHNLGLNAPRGWGWLTNPKKALYNRVYRRTTFGIEDLFKTRRRRSSAGCLVVLLAALTLVVAPEFAWQGDADFVRREFSANAHGAQFSTVSPGTAVRSVSVLTTVQLPRLSAMAAIWMSICCIGLPNLRSAANRRPNSAAASLVYGHTTSLDKELRSR